MRDELESVTRAERVDRLLAKAGWARDSRRLVDELFLYGDTSVRSDGEGAVKSAFAGSALLLPDGRPIALVVVKRRLGDPLEGEPPYSDYADRCKRKYGIEPYIFFTSGDEIWFWRRGMYSPRQVSGFFTQDDLERLSFIDRFREAPSAGLVDTKIVDRGYQIEAVKTIAERIELGDRRFLLVLATGTGKTRIAVAIADLLRRQKWIQRVLFLADRRELVKQSIAAFKDHLPDTPRCWIEGGVIDNGAPIHAATYPGMMGLYRQLSPGYYDLIVCDESHRSIYFRYKSILEYFDAIYLGLTATPTDFIERNTFELFDCEDGLPTLSYGYDEAVRDRYLVPYRPVHVARTHFQLTGLKRGELPEEMQQQVRVQGIDPDDFSFEGTDLERTVSNSGTNDSIAREFMEHSIKDSVGIVPAKSIIFAVSHRHALELYKSFNRLYPHLQRRGFAKVIDSHMERSEETLDDFKYKDLPRVAISVDMLDTGIDVPSIRNLVFAKPIFSKVKFWQMIGRGTRKWTDPVSGQEKRDFLIIDHWDSFDYFQVEKDGQEGAVSEPLPSRLFRLRLEKLAIFASRKDLCASEEVRTSLQAMLRALPLDNANVAPLATEIRALIDDATQWTDLDRARFEQLSHRIAPLMRYGESGPWSELQFENVTEQLALAYLKADEDQVRTLRGRVVELLRLLPKDLPEVRRHAKDLAFARTTGFWEHLSYRRILDLRDKFASLMRYRSRCSRPEIVQLEMIDRIAQRHWLVYGPGGEGTFAENYRLQVEAMVRRLAAENPALKRLAAGGDVDDEDLSVIGGLLEGPDLFISEARLREAYGQPAAGLASFLRHILGQTRLPSRETAISEAFDAWVSRHPRLGATQLLFIRTLRHALIQRAEVATLEALRRPPFNGIGDPECLFAASDLEEILDLAVALAA